MAFMSTLMLLFFFTIIVIAMLILVLLSGSGSLDVLKEQFIPGTVAIINERIQNFKSLREKIAEEKSLISASKFKIGEAEHLLQDPVMVGTSASHLQEQTAALKSALMMAEMDYSELCDQLNGITSREEEFKEVNEYNKHLTNDLESRLSRVTGKKKSSVQQFEERKLNPDVTSYQKNR